MPKFTIGIPTFNRAALLAEALRAAVNQTYGDLEIIVSDNASTDDTAQVVQQFGNRVRYFRNETNLGPIANFFRLVELASGKYFSWLQDDDCIFANFVQRAAAGLDHFSQAAVYGAYAAVTPRLHCLATSWLYGPPLPLNWPSGTPQSFRGDLIAPLSLCVSVAIPPVIAFRTAALRAAAARCDRSIPLFIERTLLADVACRGEVVLDPFVAGEFRSHADQTYRVIQVENPDAFKEQWLQMARHLDALPLKRNWRWRQRLCQAVREITPQQRQQWKQDSQTWPEDISLCRDMRAALTAQPPPKRVPLSPSGIAKAGMRAARSLLSRVID